MTAGNDAPTLGRMNPWGHIAAGLVAFLFGALLLIAGIPDASGLSLIGLVIATGGGVFLLIGVIAEGVRIGNRADR